MSHAGAHPAGRNDIEPQGGGQRVRGDVYVGSMAAGTRRVPGSGSAKGRTALVDLMHDAVARVRQRLNGDR
jgi:hypothetical protein